MADLQAMADGLIKGQAQVVSDLVQKAVDEGVGPEEILNEGLIAGMNIIGARFKKNEVYVPEVLIAARAMHAGMKILEPLLAEAGVKPLGKVAVGTVKGDLHDIGKNLVVMMLKGAGFSVEDLGVDFTIIEDGCKVNGGVSLHTIWEIRDVRVPIVNVNSRDNGDSNEKFGSELTENPAWLR